MQDIKELLDYEAKRINSPQFIDQDPVQFPRRFEKLADIEISALLCATIAWGNRKMICRNCEKMLSLMDYQPLEYVLDQGYEDLPDQNIHRTFFAENFRYYLRGLHDIYQKYGTLQQFAKNNVNADGYGFAWNLVNALNLELIKANDGKADCRCLPQQVDSSALKRINMALRWLVRNDGIVDLGVWDIVKPSQLSIPLDVHVSRVARDLGLLQRKSNDRKAVEELTSVLREFNAEDPILYDFALFGIGMESKNLQGEKYEK